MATEEVEERTQWKFLGRRCDSDYAARALASEWYELGYLDIVPIIEGSFEFLPSSFHVHMIVEGAVRTEEVDGL